eukprot:284818518_5
MLYICRRTNRELTGLLTTPGTNLSILFSSPSNSYGLDSSSFPIVFTVHNSIFNSGVDCFILSLFSFQFASWSRTTSPKIHCLWPDIPPEDVAAGHHIDWPGIFDVVHSVRSAVQCCPELHKVWRDWAELNFHLAQCADRRVGYCATLALETCPLMPQLAEETAKLDKARDCFCCSCDCHDVEGHESAKQFLVRIDDAKGSLNAQVSLHILFVLEATAGFLRSLGLRPKSPDVQNMLRLLALWFKVREAFFLALLSP